MPKHTLKLLFLLAAFAVAPANAGHRLSGGVNHPWAEATTCPHERARLEALAKAEANQAAKAPTRITLVEVLPSERPLRNVAPGAYFTP
jgi:hypothetical protein